MIYFLLILVIVFLLIRNHTLRKEIELKDEMVLKAVKMLQRLNGDYCDGIGAMREILKK